MELSDFDVWEFKRGDNGWLWRRVSPDGELVNASRTNFDSLDACAADARRCGYTGEIRELADNG